MSYYSCIGLALPDEDCDWLYAEAEAVSKLWESDPAHKGRTPAGLLQFARRRPVRIGRRFWALLRFRELRWNPADPAEKWLLEALSCLDEYQFLRVGEDPADIEDVQKGDLRLMEAFVRTDIVFLK